MLLRSSRFRDCGSHKSQYSDVMCFNLPLSSYHKYLRSYTGFLIISQVCENISWHTGKG